MLPVEAAINRVRRDLRLHWALKVVFGCAVATCFVIAVPENVRLLVLLGIGSIWLWLSMSSARGSRAAAASSSLIATGRFEEAERNIEQTVRTFNVFRTVKLQALHNLAMLRHAQRRWHEAAALSRALLRQRLGTAHSLSRTARLLLADSLLEMNDLRGAHEALMALYRERLDLDEVLNLLTVQLDYLARIGAWDAILENVMAKVRYAELLPAISSARAQALIALAAQKRSRSDLAGWLQARAQLIADVDRLIKERPMLRELWQEC